MKKRKSLKTIRLNKEKISQLDNFNGGRANNSYPICHSDICTPNLTRLCPDKS